MIVLQILGLFIIASVFLYSLVDVIIEFDDRVDSSIRLGVLIFVIGLALIEWYLGNWYEQV